MTRICVLSIVESINEHKILQPKKLARGKI